MSKFWRPVFVLALIAAAFGLRAPYLHRKIFNTDEGSTITFAQQILAGDVLYRDSADIRTPLVPYLKAAILAVAGNWNIPALRVVTTLLLGLCAAGLWRLARRLGDETAGLGAAVAFTVLSFGMLESMEGFALHTEWFLVVFSVAAFLAFARASGRPAFRGGALTGALFALSALSKQPGVFDFGVALVLTGLLAASRPGERRAVARFAAGELAGFAAVLGLTLAYFASHGALRDLHYYAWTFNQAKYTQEQTQLDRLGTVIVPLRLMKDQLPALLALGLAGAAGLLWSVRRSCRQRPFAAPLLPWLVLGWSASGLVAATLSGRGFSHYAIQVIPGFSLACGWAVARALDWARAGRVWRAGAVALSLAALAGVTSWQLTQRYRTFVRHDDFTPVHAEIVHAFTRPDERILVWGFFPEFYVHVERLPATKFVCTNFLTGLIPWTNLESLIDTSYAVVPNADAEFAAELRRQPPAMLVDLGRMRGYFKYPMLEQRVLGPELIAHYASVQPVPAESVGFRYYRRLAEAPPAALPAGLAEDAAIRLTPSLPRTETLVPRLRVRAPAGVTRVELFRDGQLFRRLEHPAAPECDAEFFVPAADAAAKFRAVVFRAAAAAQGAEVDLGAFLENEARTAVLGPALRFAGQEFAPLAGGALDGLVHPVAGTNRWLAHAPSFLRYARPPAMTTLHLAYGLDEEVYFPTVHHGASNGIDLAVDFTPDAGGAPRRLFARRLRPAVSGTDQGPQTASVEIPGFEPGVLTLRMLPGENSDPGFDWAYWTSLSGSARQPLLTFRGQQTAATESRAADQPGLTDLTEDRWLAHPPARLAFPFLAGARALEFDYGMEPNCYNGSLGTTTDGVRFRVVAEFADGASEELFSRLLEPAKNEADRGVLHARVALPERPWSRVAILTNAGPRGDLAYDWAWLGRLKASAD